MEQEEEGFQIQELISLFMRRKWLFLFTSMLVLIAAMIVVFKLPATYRSTGLILVEQQEIPTQWVNSTVESYADERIQAIGQRVLTTDNLGGIIEKFNLYPDDRRQVSIDEKVIWARDNFLIENVQASIRDRRTGMPASATVAFRISFVDPSPEVARDVTKELVQLYLDENVQSRTRAITDTRQFLESEADRLEKNLADIEKEIADFKEQNQGALPEHQSLNITAYQRTEEQIAEIDRTISALGERKIILQSGIDNASRFIQAGRERTEDTQTLSPREERLVELNREFASLQTKYSDAHPDLIKLRREIETVEASLLEEEQNAVDTTLVNVFSEPTDASVVRLRTELAAATNEQESLRVRRSDLTTKLEELDRLINQTPEVERDYRSLIRDHENIQTKYNDIRSKQNSARVSESLEIEQKGERFTLIEPPRLPTSPFKPDRKKLSVLALGLSFLSGFSLIFGVDWMSGRVRSVRGLKKITGVPVLATVGVIKTPADLRRSKLRMIILITIIGLLVLAAVMGAKYYGIDKVDFKPSDVRELLESWRDKIHIPGLDRG